MAKQEKEVEKWVTVNGARVPIFKDGSIGGPKALRDKVKATQESKQTKDPKRAHKEEVLRKDGMKDKDIKTYLDRDERASELDRKAETTQSISSEEYRKLKKEAAELREQNNELRWPSKQTKEQKTIQKNEDDKEKQIAKNKAEADDRNGKKVTKTTERTTNQTREEELKSKIKQLEKNAFNKDARAVLNELRARADEHRRFESDREDMQARLKSLKAKEKELTKTSAFKPEARQTLKELRARIEEIQLMERNDAHELTSYKRKK